MKTLLALITLAMASPAASQNTTGCNKAPQIGAMYQCVQTEARLFSAADDSASDVATAAIAGCTVPEDAMMAAIRPCGISRDFAIQPFREAAIHTIVEIRAVRAMQTGETPRRR